MANPILLKSSSTAGAVPAAGSLTVRELALNTADGRLFTKTGAGAVVEFARKDAVPAGSGTCSGTNTGDQDLSGKQDALVSGINIKTIGGASLLGAGDIHPGLQALNINFSQAFGGF